ncbi:hypothetical protein B5E41_30360 [Rhizobium esperanzae]|uniref:Uncharacterized protein n=1 Tax=Rhizobium esperanzae TaxID=1967781 RepID=A0A246DKR7_9HYPH|nr:hypothetical protein [Rhizobium esperanzae]OWO89548.1 hypothetical protein B5E41_30360 [Rhizobium esperanzae]
MADEDEDYGPSSMKVLEGMEPGRKRPIGPGFVSNPTDVLTLQNASNYLGRAISLLEAALEDGALKSLSIADLDAFEVEAASAISTKCLKRRPSHGTSWMG